MTKLDFSYMPKQDFSVAKCTELYEDFIADNQAVPNKIYVRAYQAVILTGGRQALIMNNCSWRGVPLVIK